MLERGNTVNVRSQLRHAHPCVRGEPPVDFVEIDHFLIVARPQKWIGGTRCQLESAGKH